MEKALKIIIPFLLLTFLSIPLAYSTQIDEKLSSSSMDYTQIVNPTFKMMTTQDTVQSEVSGNTKVMTVSYTSSLIQATVIPSIVTITFTTNGLDSEANFTLVTIDKVSYTSSDLPLVFTWVPNSIHRITTYGSVTQGTDKLYRFNLLNREGLTGSYYTTPSTDTTLILNYTIQYRITILTSGILTSNPHTIYLNGTPIGTTSSSRFNYWVNNSFNGTLSLDQAILGSNGRRFFFTKWEEDNSTTNPRPLIVNGPSTYTAQYRTQLMVSIIANYEANGSVTPSGTNYYDPGTNLAVQCSPNPGYFFQTWTATRPNTLKNSTLTSTSVIINGMGTIIANFASTTLQINATLSGITDVYKGTVLTIDNTPYTITDLKTMGPFYWIAGSKHIIEPSSALSISNEKRYSFVNWIGAMELSGTVYTVPYRNTTIIARYRPQYYLTVNNGGYGTASGQGWYLDGTRATFNVAPTAVSVGALLYTFNGWESKNDTGYTGKDSTQSITITGPITETATWIDNKLTLPSDWLMFLGVANIGIITVGIILFLRWSFTKPVTKQPIRGNN